MDKEDSNELGNESLIHDLDKSDMNSFFSPKLIFFLIFIVLLGIGSGYLLAGSKSKTGGVVGNVTKSGKSAIPKGTIIGSNDTKTFKDSAEGVLREGGIDGEGQYHLVRPGGESQNVYLTSSVVDLSKFLGSKIKIWGETNAAQKAGWLMDVGRVEVLE